MEESSPIVKLVPGMKAKVLAFLIPVVVVVGILMIVSDHMNVANAQEQSAQKAGALLIAYCLFSFRGLNRYRIFFDLYPDKILWRQGFGPLSKSYTIKYSDIESLVITSLTTTMIFSLKPESGLPKELRLAPAFRKSEGTLAKPDVENLEKEMASMNPAVRDLYYLKYEIEKRKANQTSITKTIY